MSIDENSNKSKRPFGRSLGDFENLSEAEKKLIACAARGKVCLLGESAPEVPTVENLIRPDLIRFLALGGDENAPVHEKGVKLVGAYIGAAAGEKPRALDLEGAQLLSSLWLIKSRFQNRPNFRETQGKSLNFAGSVFPGLRAERLKLGGRLFLERTISRGELKLGGAEINGRLSCKEARFENKRGVSFSCDRAKIGGSVFLSEDFLAIGRVRFNGVEIGGQLVFKGGKFINKNDIAISCNSAKIGGSVFCDGDFHAIGEVRLIGAYIGGDLLCRGGRFENESNDALCIERAKIGRNVNCDESFHAIGRVSFSGTDIAGDLCCRDGRFENKDGKALNFDRSKVGGEVFCDGNFHSIGIVSLIGADIGASLSCRGGRFENENSVALICDFTRIKNSLFCDFGFYSTGEVHLQGLNVNNDLICEGGRFDNEGSSALTCDGAVIGGKFNFCGLRLINGYVSLAHSSIGTLYDAVNSWPEYSLILDGFRYERIAASSFLDAKSRIAWLDKQQPMFLAGDKFALQPWIHLAKVLREQGHFREAVEVDIAREERLCAAGKIGDRRALLSWTGKWGQLDGEGHYASFLTSLSEQITWFLHWLYGKFSGYGHRPIKILYFAVAVWFALALVYTFEADHFTLANSSLTKTHFNPWAYSLDLILPVVQLGEFAKWTHVSDGSWVTLSGWTGFLIGAEKIFGWVAALTLAAIATGLVKRKDG